MADVAAHFVVQRSGSLLIRYEKPARTAHKQATRPDRDRRGRQNRQRRLNIEDEQMFREHAQNAQECDEPASSCMQTDTQAHHLR